MSGFFERREQLCLPKSSADTKPIHYLAVPRWYCLQPCLCSLHCSNSVGQFDRILLFFKRHLIVTIVFVTNVLFKFDSFFNISWFYLQFVYFCVSALLARNLTPVDDIILEECRAKLEGSFSENQ